MGAISKRMVWLKVPSTWRRKVHMGERAKFEKSMDDARMKKENPK